MKKFILKVSVFFLVVLVFDILSGKVFSYLANHVKGGVNKHYNYICNETNDDILVFGSSRARYHYNPIIISDSLGMSCYNCGQDANGIILYYGRYQLIRQRYHPKVLIYDIMPIFDLLVGEDNHKYLKDLRPYYDRKGISEMFVSVDDMEKYKMISQMYRYNSRFVQIISDYLHPLRNEGIKGFYPQYEEMDTMKISKRSKDTKEPKPIYDPLKIEYINKMVNESKDTKVIFVVSPCWDGMDTTSLALVKTICQQQAIPFIDYSNNPKYFHHNEYFKDGTHLNARGADEFTRDIIQELKKIVTN